ncbi:MAG: hypothetical protein RLZZ608_196 [Actinomycetota bacterium]
MYGEISAWVESPLQLLGALEHASLAAATDPDRVMTIVPRGGDAQLEHTASFLADRVHGDAAINARIALDVRVIPAARFAAGTAWVIGDAYSGQVQARLDRVQPSAVTIVDDGAITRLLARQLVDGAPLLRPRAPRLLGGLRRELASRTTRRLRALAADGRLTVTTYLSDDDAVAQLRSIGAHVTTHRFDATRRLGQRAVGVPRDARIVLGTARVADGLTDAGAELQRIAELARSGAVAYLPHRREPDWFVTAVGRLPETTVVAASLPIELALAGTERPLEIVAAASTAEETLPIVLRGSGSTVSADARVWEVTS